MAKRISLWIMALFYVAAGVRHFTHPGFYMQIMPPYLPAHAAMVFVSGLAEVAIGVGLAIPRVTRGAAWAAVALLVAVFPANLHMWMNDVHVDGITVPTWFHAVRLPMQGVLIAWALSHTRKVVSVTHAPDAGPPVRPLA